MRYALIGGYGLNIHEVRNVTEHRVMLGNPVEGYKRAWVYKEAVVAISEDPTQLASLHEMLRDSRTRQQRAEADVARPYIKERARWIENVDVRAHSDA
jgi:hypothetical protein